jgi:hypothetical protein
MNLKAALYRILEVDRLYVLPQVVRRFEDAGLTADDVYECLENEWLVLMEYNGRELFFAIDEHK